MSVMKDAMNVEAVELVAPIRTLNGSIQREDTESSSNWGDLMLTVGDYVIYVKDGARGVVFAVEDGRCQVMWEDTFVSWEPFDKLKKDKEPDRTQLIKLA